MIHQLLIAVIVSFCSFVMVCIVNVKERIEHALSSCLHDTHLLVDDCQICSGTLKNVNVSFKP